MQPCTAKLGKSRQKHFHEWVTWWSTAAFRSCTARFRMHQIRPWGEISTTKQIHDRICTFQLPHTYYQLELDEESGRLTIMSTVWGNVRMKWLSMGLLSAQDFYDERMHHLIHDIKKHSQLQRWYHRGRNNIKKHDQTIVKGIAKV